MEHKVSPSLPYVMILHLLVVADNVAKVDAIDQTLACNSQRCHCTESNGASTVVCYFSGENFYLTTRIAEHVENVSIRGSNFSLFVETKPYDESWSNIKHFEDDGSEGNVSVYLSSNFTAKLTRSEILRLKDISQLILGTDVFSEMAHLKHLDLSGSRFPNTNMQTHRAEETEILLNSMVSFGSTILETLNLSRVQLSNTHRQYNVLEHLLRSVSNVKHLDLSNTRAYLSFATLVESLPELVSLNISGTQEHPFLSCMQMLVLLSNLEVLRMDDWPVSASTSYLPKLSQPTNYSISTGVTKNRNCSNVDLIQGGYYALPPKLKELHLEGSVANKFFIDLERDVCIHSKLEYLNVRQLNVRDSIGSITGLHNLRFLDVSSLQSPITTQNLFNTDVLNDMPSLESVIASNNSLYKTEETNLEHLFYKNEKLRFVDMRQNGLHALPYNIFSGNRFLEKIDLSLNRMEILSLNLSVCLHLESISVEHNNLHIIEASTVVHLDHIQRQSGEPVRVFAKENRLECNCKNIDFIKWVQRNGMNGEELTCKTKEGKEYIKEFDLQRLEYGCLKQTSTANPNLGSEASSLFQYGFGGLVGVLFTFASIIIIFYQIRRKRRNLRHSDDIPLQDCSTSVDGKREEDTVINTNSAAIDNIYYIGMNESMFKTDKRDPHFAAFLAYTHVDRDFVLDKLYDPLQKHLEESFPRWNERLLTVLYDKNFLPGQCTMDLCRAAVYSSYVTVAIISDAFTRSTWCHYELEIAIEAKVPNIPVYLSGVDTNSFPAILKYIYENNVRIFWPKPDKSESAPDVTTAELSVLRDLAFSVSTYIKQQI